MPDWTAIGNALGVTIADIEPARGGCINAAATLTTTAGERLFVKANGAGKLAMFEAEADALCRIASSKTIRVPHPLSHGTVGAEAYLALEHIAFGTPRPGSWEKLGEALAALHRESAADGQFGWPRDNAIGETPQPNTWETSWATFFTEHRLRHQFALAARNGYRFEQSDALLDRVVESLSEHHPSPAPLHGDLWSGNAAFDINGDPVVFDPASYYGDPETDLAFTEMFGGFAPAFYSAYHAANPPASGHRERKAIYNLYHLLNHTNLFGGSYAQSAQETMARLLD